jgi:hypothetical protein
MNRFHLLVRGVVALVMLAPVAMTAAQQRVRVPARSTQQAPLTGIDALRAVYKSGKPSDAEKIAYTLIWDDVRQPEVLFMLGSSEERLRKPDDAGTFYTLFLRTLAESKGQEVPADVAKQKPFAERRLKALRQDPETLDAAYAKTAAGKKFPGPEHVDDGWMNNVRGDLFSLHGLYAWKLLGGRKDAEPDWIHNTQGTMHRSGLKRADEVEGRKGVLFTVPLKDMNSQDADASNREGLQKLGHNSHLETTNVGGGALLRAGIRGYGFPVLVKVRNGDKELLSEKVETDKWSDLKVAVPGTKGKPVTMEFIVPEGQKYSEGVWIDYVDFFDD